MSKAGHSVVSPDGTFGVLSDGRFALFNASEECPACCGRYRLTPYSRTPACTYDGVTPYLLHPLTVKLTFSGVSPRGDWGSDTLRFYTYYNGQKYRGDWISVPDLNGEYVVDGWEDFFTAWIGRVSINLGSYSIDVGDQVLSWSNVQVTFTMSVYCNNDAEKPTLYAGLDLRGNLAPDGSSYTLGFDALNEDTPYFFYGYKSTGATWDFDASIVYSNKSEEVVDFSPTGSQIYLYTGGSATLSKNEEAMPAQSSCPGGSSIVTHTNLSAYIGGDVKLDDNVWYRVTEADPSSVSDGTVNVLKAYEEGEKEVWEICGYE